MSDSKSVGEKGIERVAPVVDPGLSPEARDQVAREIGRATSEAGDTAGGCGLMLTIAGAVTVVVLHIVAGLNWWWMLAAAAPLTIGIILAGVLGARSVPAGDSRVIQPSDLDAASRRLMLQTQDAIRIMLKPRDYAENWRRIP